MGWLVCTNCGFIGAPKERTRGSFRMELFLWLCLLVPGLIYSVWRLTSKAEVCPLCGSEHMIPEDSPIGRRIAADSRASGADLPAARKPGGHAVGRGLARVVRRLTRP